MSDVLGQFNVYLLWACGTYLFTLVEKLTLYLKLVELKYHLKKKKKKLQDVVCDIFSQVQNCGQASGSPRTQHMETKFCKINAEKCPFLTDRLKIRYVKDCQFPL
jgi:hypothetical protein